MKHLSFLIISIFLLSACAGTGDQSQENQATSLPEMAADTLPLDVSAEKAPEDGTFTLTAKFMEFHLGDAEHYVFEDASGTSWDFAGSESEHLEFAQELPEAEADENNQGWGANPELQGKWVALTYVQREQPQYIDGPMVSVDIISEAVLVEK